MTNSFHVPPALVLFMSVYYRKIEKNNNINYALAY